MVHVCNERGISKKVNYYSNDGTTIFGNGCFCISVLNKNFLKCVSPRFED